VHKVTVAREVLKDYEPPGSLAHGHSQPARGGQEKLAAYVEHVVGNA